MALDVKLRDWTQRDRQANRNIAFSLWNGRISINVYNDGNMANKLFRRNINDEELILIGKVIDKVVNGSPETKCSVQFQAYDRQSKQFRAETVFSFEKDSKQLYKISVTDCTKQQTFTFTLKASAAMSMGNEPFSEANLSAIKLESLKEWITSAKIWGPATYVPFDRNKQGNRGGNGGGNYNRQPSNGGGTAEAAVNDDDALPF